MEHREWLSRVIINKRNRTLDHGAPGARARALTGATYADVARDRLAESSVKRLLAKGDLPLSRIDQLLRVLKMDFAEIARKVADAQPLHGDLTDEQEAAVVADRKLLLMAVCCLSHWTFEQIIAAYTLNEAECVACLVRLDRLGIIELRPLNRYRLKVAKTFREPDGPVMAYFRQHVVPDYFGGGFAGEGELLLLVHDHRARAGSTVQRAPVPRRAGFCTAAPRRPAAAAAAQEALHAPDRHAVVALRGLSRPEARVVTRAHQNCHRPVATTHAPSAPLVTACAITGAQSVPVRT